MKIIILILGLLFSMSASADDYLVLGITAKHFQNQQQDWNETNPGLSFERRTHHTEWATSLTGGVIRNSHDTHSAYLAAGLHYRTSHHVTVGIALSAMQGEHENATRYAPLPSITWDSTQGIGASLTYIPKDPDMPAGSDAVFLQLRFKL